MVIPEIDVASAKNQLEAGDVTFLDMRDGGSYSAGRIPAAQHLSDSSAAGILEGLEPEDHVIIYCYHGNSSKGATAYFMDKGFTNVQSMSGGFADWAIQFPDQVERG